MGKNLRGAKRGSSASSYVSTVSMVLFVLFCLFGVWMLTSSSIVPSSSTTTNADTNHHHTRAAVSLHSDRQNSRFVLRDPPPALDDTQGELPEDAVKGDDEDKTGSGESAGQEDQEKVSTGSAGVTEEEEETRRSNEETQQPENQENQQLDDSNSSGGTEENQIQSEEKQSDEEQLPKSNDGEGGTHDQNGDDEQQQKSETSGDDGQQDSNQQQQGETEIQQESNTEIDENHGQIQQKIEEGVGDGGQQSEEHMDGGGISSQAQIEHDTEGISEDHHQQQQQQQQEQEESSQEQQSDDVNATGDSKDEQQQPSEDVNATGEDTETTSKDIEGNSKDQPQESSEQQQSGDEHATGELAEETSKDQQQQTEDVDGTGESNESKQQSDEELPNGSGAHSEDSKRHEDHKGTWKTQADQSENEKERRKTDEPSQSGGEGEGEGKLYGHEWELCNVTAGPDYIPCLDNEKAIKQLHSFKHFEHRERHCPEEGPTCLVPLPKGYTRPIEWPKSRNKIWYNNVPHTKLAEVKGHQNWVKVSGEYLEFPGGGTQFIHGALHYIDFIQQSARPIAWGKHTRVILDVGCGVASFGGYLFERDVLTMSFAPKDEHEAQVQFALERGIPAFSAVMGSQRLPFPSRVFDVVHCARCRVPWHANDGALLLELNRVLRPGGFFVWSATPVYQKLKEDVEIWKAMSSLTLSMCWDLYTIKKDKLNGVGAAFYRKPISNECYDSRKHHSPPMCKENDDPNAAWYVPLQSCMHRVPINPSERGSRWPEEWPRRVQVPPYWLNNSQTGVYGKPAPDDFRADYEHWKQVVNKSYLSGLGINWSKVRNVMDMRAVYGGFAAALRDLKVWVMNVVNIDSPDTLPIIYERGLFGMYHDWCESFSTYPRTYDLLHADHLFSQLKKRCKIVPVIAEIDRIVRPGGKLIVSDQSEVVNEIESLLKSLHWEIRLTFSKNQEGMLCAEKSDWRPEKFLASS